MSMQKKTWRFLDTGKESALFNMALDEIILKAVNREQSPPTIRLYEWRPEAITIGYSQRIDDVIDYELCLHNGVGVARRPTGGRVVFHKNEIAYSVAGLVADCHFGGNIQETYRKISAVLCVGIAGLGVNAVLGPGKSLSGKTLIGGRISPCFLSTSRYEITVDGKKIVGSAQRRFKKSFLQQGSILTGPGSEEISDYMKDRTLAEHTKQLLSENSIDLTTILKGSFSSTGLKNSLRAAFQKKLNMELDVSIPTDSELECARSLALERYESKGWLLNNER